MGTIALKATAGGSVQLKADDALTTDEVLKVFSNSISSRVLTGAELTAVGIIGTSPEATLWANGDITGSSSNGSFTKLANGDLVCRLINSGTEGNGATRSFSCTFDTIPSLVLTVVSTSNRNISCAAVTTTSFQAYKYQADTNAASTSGYGYHAIGRWK